MSYAPVNNQTTADQYVDRVTCRAPGSARFNIDVANAAVFIQFGERWPDTQWGYEVFLAPGFRSFDRRKDALRARSAVPGTPAQITIEPIALAELAGPIPPSA